MRSGSSVVVRPGRGWRLVLLAGAMVMAGGGGADVAARGGESAEVAKRRATSYFALNGTKAFHIPEQVDGAIRQRIGWMHEAEVYWDRSDLWWHVVEPERGKFDFSRADLVYETLHEAGIQWYPILCYGAAWYIQERSAPVEDDDFERYANYVRKTVEHFKGRIPYWSVWNEPNIVNFWSPEPDAAAYTRLLKLAHKEIKAADPEAQVCAPAIAPLGHWDRKFVEKMYQEGAKDYFDIFDYHYYRNHAPERDVPGEIAEIRAVMRRYGDGDKPLWISESGVSSAVATRFGGADWHAALVVRNQLLCLGLGVERFFYFDLQNWYDDRPHEWDTQLGLVTAAGTPKKAFEAYKALVQQVDHKPFVGLCRDLPEGVYGALVHDPEAEQYMLALWTRQKRTEKDVTITAADLDKIAVYDMYGKRLAGLSQMEPEERQFTLRVGPQPHYVHGVDPGTYLRQAGAGFDQDMLIIAPGEQKPLKLTADARLGSTAKVRVESKVLPGFLAWNPHTGVLACADTAPAGKHTVTARFTVSTGEDDPLRRRVLERAMVVEVIPTLDVALRRSLEDGELTLHAAIRNQSTRSFEGPVALIAQRDGVQMQLAATPAVTLAPGAQRRVPLELPADLLDKLQDTLVLAVEFAGQQSRALQIYPARLRTTAPAIDGDLADWPDGPAMEIGRADQVQYASGPWSAANISGRCRVAFTPDALLVGLAVTDDDGPFNPEKLLEIWKSDALELYVGFCGPTLRTVIDHGCERHLGLAPTHAGDEPAVVWFHKDERVEAAQVAVAKTADGYALEARIPLAALGIESGVKRGDLLALDATLNDRDAEEWVPAGVSPGRRLTWNGDLGNWIDPSGYGLLVVQGN